MLGVAWVRCSEMTFNICSTSPCLPECLFCIRYVLFQSLCSTRTSLSELYDRKDQLTWWHSVSFAKIGITLTPYTTNLGGSLELGWQEKISRVRRKRRCVESATSFTMAPRVCITRKERFWALFECRQRVLLLDDLLPMRRSNFWVATDGHNWGKLELYVPPGQCAIWSMFVIPSLYLPAFFLTCVASWPWFHSQQYSLRPSSWCEQKARIDCRDSREWAMYHWDRTLNYVISESKIGLKIVTKIISLACLASPHISSRVEL